MIRINKYVLRFERVTVYEPLIIRRTRTCLSAPPKSIAPDDCHRSRVRHSFLKTVASQIYPDFNWFFPNITVYGPHNRGGNRIVRTNGIKSSEN